MRKRFMSAFRRNETYVVACVIGIVFLAAMFVVGLLLKKSISTPPYETLKDSDLKRVFVTSYLRFREDDGSPYLKVELHNGSLWWIKNLEFNFDGLSYSLRDSEAFKPLHFGAVRCPLRKHPTVTNQIEFDIKVSKASGYPPAQSTADLRPSAVTGRPQERTSNN